MKIFIKTATATATAKTCCSTQGQSLSMCLLQRWWRWGGSSLMHRLNGDVGHGRQW